MTGGRQSCGESIRSAFSDCWHCPQESVAFTPKVLHVLKKYISIYLDLFLNFLHLVCVWIRKYFANTMQCSILFLYFRDCTMCLWFCMDFPLCWRDVRLHYFVILRVYLYLYVNLSIFPFHPNLYLGGSHRVCVYTMHCNISDH